ncbi:MAG: glycosyltransferase family 4 protein [bacterium]|nr:glycosyltransferase family 4 protein [bacterium]
MSGPPERGVVLHAKFAAYLGWSQPFLHRLITGLEPEVPGAVLCNRRENRERFPLARYACTSSQALIRPSGAAILADVLRRSWRPWLLHAHFGWSGIRSLLVRQCLDVPLVTTFGGRDLGADLHDPLHAPLYHRLLQASDLCICVSDTLAAVLSDHGVEDSRIRVARRGADVDYFREQTRTDRDPAEPLRLLMMGRLVEKKGHADAIAALAALRASGQPAVLRIVGAGQAADVIREAENTGVAEWVDVQEPTDTAGVREHLGWSDLLVHCSRKGEDGDVEGIPNVVVEAAASGLPVLGTRHGGIPEVVVDGETGRLVPEADPKALAEALRELARDPARRHAWGTAGARLVRNRFTLAAQLEAHRDAYEGLRGVTPRAQALDAAYTSEALAAIAPAIDADLWVASRWLRQHWIETVGADVPPPHSGTPDSRTSDASPPTPSRPATSSQTSLSARERIRRIGAAWAERPVVGLPMRGYRALRRAWVAAAQRREDAMAWNELGRGRRASLAGIPGRVLRGVVKEGPAGDPRQSE